MKVLLSKIIIKETKCKYL